MDTFHQPTCSPTSQHIPLPTFRKHHRALLLHPLPSFPVASDSSLYFASNRRASLGAPQARIVYSCSESWSKGRFLQPLAAIRSVKAEIDPSDIYSWQRSAYTSQGASVHIPLSQQGRASRTITRDGQLHAASLAIAIPYIPNAAATQSCHVVIYSPRADVSRNGHGRTVAQPDAVADASSSWEHAWTDVCADTEYRPGFRLPVGSRPPTSYHEKHD